MNIENIQSLAAQLQSLGFENPGSGLLRRICFKPEFFILRQSLKKGSEQFVFHLSFGRDAQENIYSLKYYDATLKKETTFSSPEVNGVNLPELDAAMSEIDWKLAFDFDLKKTWTIVDKASWDTEQKVEAIITDLQQLETSEGGKSIATGFKIKYWAGMPQTEIVGNFTPVKNKSEVSQRFYFSSGQPGISVDEALRFLQNRWLDKQMQVKKQTGNGFLEGEEQNDSQVVFGSGFLKKKKGNSVMRGKKNNTFHR